MSRTRLEKEAGFAPRAMVPKRLPAQAVLELQGWELRRHQWQPPDVPEDATTSDLAHVYNSFWDWMATRPDLKPDDLAGKPPVTAVGLERLLRLAFLASLATDEQRPTRGSLYVPAARESPYLSILQFEPAEALRDAKTVARLCQTLSADDAVLVVREEGGELRCVEIAHLDEGHAEYQPLRPPREWFGRRAGLLITIQAPGEVRLRQGYCDYTLRGADLVAHSPAATVPQVSRWLNETHAAILGNLPAEVRQHSRLFLKDEMPVEVGFLLSTVLEGVARLRHGGTILVLDEPARAPVRVTYRTRTDTLPRLLGDFYRDLAAAWDLRDKEGGTSALARFEGRRHALLTHAASLSRLTAADGAVVLGRGLRLEGFGGIIDVDQARQSAVLGFAHPSLSEGELLRRHGTRHGSAYHLCGACVGAIAFVVSQDGEIRVFASDEHGVHFHDALSP